jgi:ubiquinol-cytochrome c reductase cytochrome c1 subunit
MLINPMRTSKTRALGRFLVVAVVECVLVTGAAALLSTASAAEEETGEAGGLGHDWQHTHANVDVENKASLQRGARNFAQFCLGCHSLKYERWSRLGQDLEIPSDVLEKDVMPPGDKPAQYVLTSMPAADSEAWFGKTPPDLSLIARARGTDYLYQLWTTYYLDPTRPTGVNNLRLPSIAMPHVLSELEGVKRAVFKTVETRDAEGKPRTEQVFDHFEIVAPGRLTTAEYEGFVRDTVNFLAYVGEPSQTARRSLGVWVVLFLLVFTWLAWLMKKEYWKDVH